MEFVLDEKNAMIHSHYGLSGRCTQVLKGTVDGQVAVMKISHPEISRPPEQAVISVARKRCESTMQPRFGGIQNRLYPEETLS
uniref:Uncharacterized protein n=1 Tax=Moniliophthora roreri TaxID=221103 RepID=A0A0W0FXI4_MONRR